MRLRVLVSIALLLATTLAYRVFVATPDAAGQPLASTECPFRGEPVVTVSADVAMQDTLPVRMHEETHARQCEALGPWRYRWRNLTDAGRLSLEAPAYCAGARARLQQREAPRLVRERMLDDAGAAFNHAPGGRVQLALRMACPELFPEKATR